MLLAAQSGAALRDLMARMGHSSTSAALIYLTPPELEARGADKRITDAIDTHVQAERAKGDDDDGAAGALVPAGTLVARDHAEAGPSAIREADLADCWRDSYRLRCSHE